MSRRGFTITEVVVLVLVLSALVAAGCGAMQMARWVQSNERHKCEVLERYQRTRQDSLNYELRCK